MAQVDFRNSTLINDVEGVWDFTPGMMQRDLVFVRMPRGIGELAKDLGVAGCDHSLTVTFLNVQTSDVQTIFSRLDGMMDPVTGTLQIPDYPSYRHCLMTSCQPHAQAVRAYNISNSNPAGTKRWDLGFDIMFRQLRRS